MIESLAHVLGREAVKGLAIVTIPKAIEAGVAAVTIEIVDPRSAARVSPTTSARAWRPSGWKEAVMIVDANEVAAGIGVTSGRPVAVGARNDTIHTRTRTQMTVNTGAEDREEEAGEAREM